MQPEVSWYIKNRVVMVKFDETVTLDDLKYMNQAVVEHFEAGAEQVHLILDNSAVSKYPVSLSGIIKDLTFMKHPKFGWDVTISPNRAIEILSSLAANVMRMKKFKFESDFKSAVERLYQLDPSLRDVASPKA